MTIQIGQGNLLEQDVDAIVNTVNTVGVMGKGVALQVKRKWPSNFKAYERAAAQGEIKVGQMFVFDLGGLVNPHFIINFPTKEHWRAKSRLDFIRTGLIDLVAVIRRLKIRSIALPPLGCGNGGLAWADVKPMIEAAFAQIPEVDVRLFEPSPEARLHELAAEAKSPSMTAGRAAVVSVIHGYQRMLYRLSMLEVQKLAYFLSVAGEPLRLNYEKGKFGPYSPTLKHVLVKMDGAYIKGVGDLNSPSSIEVLPDAYQTACRFFEEAGNAETQSRVQRVNRLIEGYETPYGLELLATVHWAARELPRTTELSEIASRVAAWNDRKREIMPVPQIEGALTRLRDLGWLSMSEHRA